jgi:hypothetical protein
MEPDAAARTAGGRPRPAFLIALAFAVGALLIWWTVSGNPAAPAQAPSKPQTPAKGQPTAARGEDLTVRLDALAQPRPSEDGGNRNPFRFYTPPAPPPVRDVAPPPVPSLPTPEGPSLPSGPPPPPPIPLKYIGLIEGGPGQGKLAAFSDCRTTMHGREGEIIAGQYRLVRIGVESVVLEYADGRGRTTVRMSGQECVGK